MWQSQYPPETAANEQKKYENLVGRFDHTTLMMLQQQWQEQQEQHKQLQMMDEQMQHQREAEMQTQYLQRDAPGELPPQHHQRDPLGGMQAQHHPRGALGDVQSQLNGYEKQEDGQGQRDEEQLQQAKLSVHSIPPNLVRPHHGPVGIPARPQQSNVKSQPKTTDDQVCNDSSLFYFCQYLYCES